VPGARGCVDDLPKRRRVGASDSRRLVKSLKIRSACGRRRNIDFQVRAPSEVGLRCREEPAAFKPAWHTGYKPMFRSAVERGPGAKVRAIGVGRRLHVGFHPGS
jgi:hypothetical protein